MGDWNLNLINHHCHKVTSDFLDLLYSRMFFPHLVLIKGNNGPAYGHINCLLYYTQKGPN